MFGKSNDTEPAMKPPPSKSPSVLGPTLTFKGELSADEDLVIQATVEGTIAHQKKKITIGEQGKVRAHIEASTIIVEGTVEGDLHGDEVVIIKKTANVSGNVFAPRITLEEGATFNGRIEMKQKDPVQSAEPSSKQRRKQELAGSVGVRARTAE